MSQSRHTVDSYCQCLLPLAFVLIIMSVFTIFAVGSYCISVDEYSYCQTKHTAEHMVIIPAIMMAVAIFFLIIYFLVYGRCRMNCCSRRSSYVVMIDIEQILPKYQPISNYGSFPQSSVPINRDIQDLASFNLV
jgi:hypothetical protein